MKTTSVVAAFLLAACGGSSTPAEEPGGDPHANSKVFHADDDEEEEEDDGVEVVGSRGKMAESAIQDGLEPHATTLQECFTTLAEEQKYLGGKVDLHWELDAEGGLVAANVETGDLGAWPVERCMLETARAITWAKPKGGPAGFTIPLEFSGSKSVLWWDEDRGNATVSKRVVELDSCDTAAARPTNVLITLYVGTRGQVQQAGFSSEQVIDDAWSECAHTLLMSWVLTDPKGKIAKLAFWWNPQDIPEAWETPEEDEE